MVRMIVFQLVSHGMAHQYRGFFKDFSPGIGIPLQAVGMTGDHIEQKIGLNGDSQTSSFALMLAQQAGELLPGSDIRVLELAHSSVWVHFFNSSNAKRPSGNLSWEAFVV